MAMENRLNTGSIKQYYATILLNIQPILIIDRGTGKGSHDPILCSPIVMSDSFVVAPHYGHVIQRTMLNDHCKQIEFLSHRALSEDTCIILES